MKNGMDTYLLDVDTKYQIPNADTIPYHTIPYL